MKFENISIDKAVIEDALQLSLWWNDGKVMKHVGFPNGVGVQVSDIATLLSKDSEKRRHYIIRMDNKAIGEMHYKKMGETNAEIGIKICDISYHNKGIGKKCLSIFINDLFSNKSVEKICINVARDNKIAQHVYEQLGFKDKNNIKKIATKYLNKNSSVKYELTPNNFKPFVK